MPTNKEIINKAIHAYESDDIEIDDDPLVSRGSDGYWVSAWVFIDKFKSKKK